MKIKAGVVGLGYWGPNYVRNFAKHEQIDLKWACDLDESKTNKIAKTYPNIKVTKNFTDLLNEKDLDLIAIATPPQNHYKLSMEALKAGKHVLIAKPLTTNEKDAKNLVAQAKKKKLLLHCDLTYLYTPSVILIKDLIKKGVIGQPLYFDSTRTNLGLIQEEVNVIWDLAIHDFSILNYLFNLKPTKVTALGSKHYKNSRSEEMAHITINYPNSFIAHIHISWLSPLKIRTILLGGSNKMIFFDDIQPDEKVKIYDKGIDINPKSISPFKPVYRSGEIIIPKLGNEEALFTETNEIVNQIINKHINYDNAKLSLDTIKLLEACDSSLKKNKTINL